jgi:hypothetical protein
LPRDIVCLRNISINTLYKGDDDDDDDDNDNDDDDDDNNNNNNNNKETPIPVTVKSKACCRMIAGVAGSKAAEGTDVRLVHLLCIVYVATSVTS